MDMCLRLGVCHMPCIYSTHPVLGGIPDRWGEDGQHVVQLGTGVQGSCTGDFCFPVPDDGLRSGMWHCVHILECVARTNRRSTCYVPCCLRQSMPTRTSSLCEGQPIPS